MTFYFLVFIITTERSEVPMNFYIYTLGCKVNAYESEVIKENFLQKGYKLDREKPDIIIVNTCSVTNVADQKSRKMVRRFKKNHNNAILVVCGCSSENKETEYNQMDIDILLGNNEKSQIVSLVENYLQTHQKYTKFYHTRNLAFEPMQIEKFTTHTRAYIKIEDGCDNFCSYCIIPYVRGKRRDKDYETVIKEAKMLVNNGHQEIVLTGIHTGSYGFNSDHDLTDLIHELSQIEALKRIRISSIEVTELNDKFLQELKTNPKICDHLHVPLQAGSDEILQKMNRKYNLEEYKEKIKKIKEIRPDISITTDVIVGHPFETEELFQKTIETVKEIAFSKIHVFPYSKREGTASSKMPMQVPETEKHERSKRLCEISSVLEQAYAEKYLGKKLEILIESDQIGTTSNYLKVKCLEEVPINTLQNVIIKDVQNGELIGEICR